MQPVLLVFSLCICFAQALLCDKCNGNLDICARSNRQENCKQYGSDQVCANFFYWNNSRPVVQKGCYQRTACKMQEYMSDNFCGRHDRIDKPCRCCCTRSGCNRLKKGCIVPSKCGRPKQPLIGKFSCPGKTRPGSVCNFTCPAGYDVLGFKTTKCVRSGATGELQWSPREQRCTRNRCPKLATLKNGKRKCANKGRYENLEGDNYLRTECKFECDFGYKLVGAATAKCKEDQTWSEVPVCVVDPCEPFQKDDFRIDICTDGNKLESVCTFECKKGFKMIGPKLIECTLDYKQLKRREWSKDPPKCVSVKCLPLQYNPTNGKVSCTDENRVNSVCTFTCNGGYDIDGTKSRSITTKCEDDDDGDELGKWSNPPARCTRIQCKPRLTKPVNGALECTKINFSGSVCTFSCNRGYDVDDSTKKTVKSTCQEDGNGDAQGEWTLDPPPTCTKIICSPPHKAPDNGEVSCSHGNNFGSVCTFRCDYLYDLDVTKKDLIDSQCVDDGDGDAVGKWSRDPPTCTIIKCRALVKPTHSTYTCTKGNTIQSACTFECDVGFKRIGERSIICMDQNMDGDSVGEWSGKEPECRQIFCDAQKHDNTVIKHCFSESKEIFEMGTVCKYECAEEGRYMVGYEDQNAVIRSGLLVVDCLPIGEWSQGSPSCVAVKCPEIKQPNYGRPPLCSNDRWFGSVCKFQCLSTYALTHDDGIVCQSVGTNGDETGKWSQEPPKCEKNECESFGHVDNGKITYTNGLKVGSNVSLVCSAGYTYKKFESAECMPIGDGMKVPHWSRRKDVCCVKCIFNKQLRIISVLDKTAARDTTDWAHIITWHYYLLHYMVTKGYAVKFGMVLYDMKADKKNSMDERRLKSLDDVVDIQYAMYDLPYGGKESNTPQGLKYAKAKHFSRYSPAITSRPKDEPYIILVKSPSSSGDISAVADDLSDSNIHVMALGFKRGDWKSEEKELASITKNSSYVSMINSLGDMMKASELVTEISKDKGCSASSRNTVCS